MKLYIIMNSLINNLFPEKRQTALNSYRYAIKLFLVFFIASFSVNGQSSFLPKNLGDNVNSPYPEINPVISPDEKTLYFTKIIPARAFGHLEKQEIWSTEKQADGSWGVAKRMNDRLNIGFYNSVLAVSGDGQTLLINGVYNRRGTLWRKRGLSVVTKVGDDWSVPVRVRLKKFSKKNRGVSSNAFMSYDGNYLVLAFTKGYNRKKLDIYFSKKKENGRWSKPKKIRSSISTGRSEEAPFLSYDNKQLYFSRKARGSSSVSDIYVSTRLDENSWKKWSTPKKLSDTINSIYWESYFKTNIKGSYAYFASENGSKGLSDIYVVKLFEENPYVLVKGTIINAFNKKTLSNKYAFKVLVDGKVIDSVKIQSDSSSYSLKLPYGKKYTIAAKVNNFVSQNEIIDVTAVKEYTVKDQNLSVRPLPYVMVSGKVLNKSTDQPISEVVTRIVIDNKQVDSIKVNPSTGEYSFQVPYGKSYKIKATGENHKSFPKTLDLTSVEEYKEMNLDLNLEFIKEKAATIKGQIIDKKLNGPKANVNDVKIFINGEQAMNAKIDAERKTFEVEVPLGMTYTINASASNFYPVYENVDVKNETEDIRVLKDLSLVPIEVGQSVRLNNIFFNPAKAVLKSESYAELDRVVQFLKDNSNIVIEIAGHTDNVGNASSNLNLSMERARSVAGYLVAKGVLKTQVSSKGYGSTKPVAENKTAAGKALNRRVEFTILDK